MRLIELASPLKLICSFIWVQHNDSRTREEDPPVNISRAGRANVINSVIHNRQRSLHWWQVIVAGDKARKTKAKILQAKLRKEKERKKKGPSPPERPRLGVLRSSRDRKKSRIGKEVQLYVNSHWTRNYINCRLSLSLSFSTGQITALKSEKKYYVALWRTNFLLPPTWRIKRGTAGRDKLLENVPCRALAYSRIAIPNYPGSCGDEETGERCPLTSLLPHSLIRAARSIKDNCRRH